MADYLDLESVIMDAEGAAAVFDTLQSYLVSSTVTGFEVLGLQPRTDICVTALSPRAQLALGHAGIELCRAIKEVSRVFYATIERGEL